MTRSLFDDPKCYPYHQKYNRKTCEEALGEFLDEAANLEGAIANAINAESELVKQGCLDPCKLEHLLKLAIKKEIVLEFLIEDVMKGCSHLKKHEKPCYPNEPCKKKHE